MSDLINRRKAIEALKELRKEYRIPLHNGDESTHFVIHFHEAVMVGSEVIGAFDGIIQALECVPSAREWIPITERMPEEDCTILLSAYDGNIRTGFYHNRMWVMDGVRPPFRDPIAWMPLPEPYEVKE